MQAHAHRRLTDELRRHRGLAIAVSGGIDSMTLAFVAHRDGPEPVRVVHAVSPAVPPHATRRVQRYAEREGWDLVLVDAGEFTDPSYLANPVDRCYFCKTNLYARIAGLTDGPIASGANLDDLGDYRPGLKAAAERRVVHPFIDAKIGKGEIRALARANGLTDIAELPAQPCLASRVETGIGIRSEDLAFIDAVEVALKDILGDTATVRCRLVRAGVTIEVGEGTDADGPIAAVAAEMCARDGRTFLGVRAYRRGSAFVHGEGAATSGAAPS